MEPKISKNFAGNFIRNNLNFKYKNITTEDLNCCKTTSSMYYSIQTHVDSTEMIKCMKIKHSQMLSYHFQESFQSLCLNLIESSSFSFLRTENSSLNVVFIKWFEIQLVIFLPMYNTIVLMSLCKIKWQKKSINITKLCLLHDLCLNVTNFITTKK